MKRKAKPKTNKIKLEKKPAPNVNELLQIINEINLNIKNEPEEVDEKSVDNKDKNNSKILIKDNENKEKNTGETIIYFKYTYKYRNY